MFASKPQLAGSLLDRVHSRGIRAPLVAGGEVYGGRQLRRVIRQRGMGYVLAVRASHVVTTGSACAVTAPAATYPPPAPATGRAPGQAPRVPGMITGRCWRWPATALPAGSLMGTACCWPGRTATPARCRTTGALDTLPVPAARSSG